MAEDAGTAQILEQMKRLEGQLEVLAQRLDGRHQQIDIGFPSVVESLDRLRREARRLRWWLVGLIAPIAGSAVVAAWMVIKVLLIEPIALD